MLKVIRYASLALLLLLGGVWAFAWVTKPPDQTLAEAFASKLAGIFGQAMPLPSQGGMQLPQGMVLGGPFTLVNQAGQTVTERDFAGRWLLVYFGFTWCPDVCPTELGTIAAALDVMGPAAERVTPVLITIDPQRDTPAQLADYVSRFHPRMQGLTGTPEQIAAVARAYRVFYSRVQRPDQGGDYTMDHSGFIYLVGPDARVRALFRPETSPEAIAGAVAAQLRG
ncbi:MAG: SCO family protein [Acetobacteraceae bacterium]|nr:SCO family protein [Acetobacteraceae bacterium]